SVKDRPPVADQNTKTNQCDGREKKNNDKNAESDIEKSLHNEVRAEMPDFPQLQSLLYGIIICVQHEPAPGCFCLPRRRSL
ncbi:MAG: hypothetical protein RLO21_14565, partial [Nitratireductor sp.]